MTEGVPDGDLLFWSLLRNAAVVSGEEFSCNTEEELTCTC